MAGSLNKVMLIGHLGKDPEIRTTQSSAKLANLSLATSQSWKDKATGERKESTQWHRVVVFNDGLAGFAERYLKKGATVYVEGQLETRKWTDNEGKDHYVTEVVVRSFNGTLKGLDGRREGVDQGYSLKDRESPADNTPPASEYAADLDDDIPF